MKNSIIKIILLFILIISYAVYPYSGSGISVMLNKNTGKYAIHSSANNWDFTGSIGARMVNVKTNNGDDAAGSYTEIRFSWVNINSYQGTIKWYKDAPVILFTIKYPKNPAGPLGAFPCFNSFPKGLHSFSYKDDNFAPPQFKLNETSTPWLFFGDDMNSFIISPASDFMVSKLQCRADTLISSGLTGDIKNIPDNFTHSTILVIAKDINKAWNIWGKALRAVYQRKLPANDDGPILKYFGYWTDNGADYYYNYDTSLGYSKTLLNIKNKYEQEGIPLGYIQLDSWWYDKSIYDVNGNPDADYKNKSLPYGKWNRYGGIMDYTADQFLFPNGLSSFQKEIDLPLITHSRWIDPKSPYHNNYKISGYAAIDPEYWNHIADYLKRSGVICYEQDWLNYIYLKSPEMQVDVNTGNDFTDQMAGAFAKAGIAMQYCMAMPRHFLQGLKYNNLTTIRTSEDRFEPAKWKAFLYTSRLAYECGMYPWCDVFKSSELGNMILAVLSDGPVGTGDAAGKEYKTNILKACREDGELIKPDAPVLPVNEDYINDSKGNKSATIGYTFTQHRKIITGYVFAFSADSTYSKDVKFIPQDFGIKGKILVFNPLTGQSQVLKGGAKYKGKIDDNNYSYYVVAPFLSSGIAFIGDTAKIVTAGKKRIADIKDGNNTLEIKVLYSKGESSVNLLGYSEKPVKCSNGKIIYNNKTHFFNLLLPSGGKKELIASIKVLD